MTDTHADQHITTMLKTMKVSLMPSKRNLHHDEFRNNHAIKVVLVFIDDEKLTRPRGDSRRKNLGQNPLGQLSSKYILLARCCVKKTLGGVGVWIQGEGAGSGGERGGVVINTLRS